MASATTAHSRPKKGGLLSRLSFRPLVYGYANARVHGLYSRLLDADELKALLAAPSFDAMVEVLERTPYKEELVALSLRFKGDELIELAVSRRFASFAAQLLKVCPAADRPTLQALLGRWDAHNLKVVFLARRQKEPFEKIAPYLVLAGSLKESELQEIYSAPDAEEILHLLRLAMSGDAAGAMSSSSLGEAERFRKLVLAADKAPSLQPLMDEFDRLAFRMAASAAAAYVADGGEVRRLVQRAADEKNLSTVLRLSSAGSKPSDIRSYLVPGGSVSDSKWLALLQAGALSNPSAHLDSRLGWKEALDAYAITPSAANLEVALARSSAAKNVRIFHRSQMSLGVLVGALMLKEQEMANIRKIVRAKSLRLPAAEIEKMLVQVR